MKNKKKRNDRRNSNLSRFIGKGVLAAFVFIFPLSLAVDGISPTGAAQDAPPTAVFGPGEGIGETAIQNRMAEEAPLGEGAVSEAEEADSSGNDSFEAAEILGIQPGRTTAVELKEHPIFQKPILQEKMGDYDVLSFRLPDVPETPYVQLLIQNDIVAGVIIHLGQTRDAADARKAFDDVVRGLEPIQILDNDGHYREIYPEKGFSFVLEKGDGKESTGPTNRVTQIITETIKPDFFLVRADMKRKGIFSLSTLSKVRQDAQNVLKIAPDNAAAHWLLAETFRLTEDYGRAREAAARAVQLDDKVPEYHFTMMRILHETGSIDDGLRYLDAVVPVCDKTPFHSAELAILRGEFLRKKADPDYNRAMREAQRAVGLLKPKTAAGSGSETDILQAKELTAQAYLLLGQIIAAKDWKTAGEKEKAFLWVAAADKLLKETVKENPRSFESVLNLGLTASEIGLEIPSCPQMDPWVDQMTAAGDGMLEKSSDPSEKEVVSLKCGEALFNAFLIADARNDLEKGEEYANKSLDYLEPFCESSPEKILAVIGPIDYEFGLFLNETADNRDRAMKCLTQAAALITSDLALDGSTNDGDQGIRLVNIGKAFWTDGQRERGLEMTRRGVEAIEKTVEAGNMERSELIIPCQNLVTILTALGEADQAEIYAEKVRELTANEP